MAKLYISIVLYFLFSFTSANAEDFTGKGHSYWGFNNTGKSLFILKPQLDGKQLKSGGENKSFFLKNLNVSDIKENMALLQKNRVASSSISFDYQTKNVEQGVFDLEVFHKGKWREVWKIDAAKNSLSNGEWVTQSVSFNFYPGNKNVRFFGTASGEDDAGGISLSNISLQSLATNSFIEYKYDELGRLICAVDNLNDAREFEYDDAGNRKNVSIGSCN